MADIVIFAGTTEGRKLGELCRELGIDALACGVTFSFEENFNILRSITIIGCTTFVISAGGVYVGNIFGDRYKAKAQLVGGIILIFIGTKILLEHTMGITLGF